MSEDPVLETRDLTVRYGGVTANDRISLRVMPGSVTGLIGPNGAGKTTFLDAITGMTPSTGQVCLGGHPLAGLPAHARARRGLARTWQSVELFDDLTVRENLQVAAVALTARSVLGDLVHPARRRIEADPGRALALLDIEDLADERPASLSLGQRKLVGVARALAASPRVVVLDEPAAGLDVGESRLLGQRLRAVAERGIAVLLVDHDMSLVLEVCDRVAVLEFGALIAEGTPAEIRSDRRVVAAYLGSSAEVAA